MPRSTSPIEKIRELAWVNEPVDPNVCGCRHLLCCEQTGHVAGAKAHASRLKRCGVSGRNISAQSAVHTISAEIAFGLHDGRVRRIGNNSLRADLMTCAKKYAASDKSRSIHVSLFPITRAIASVG